MRNKTTRLTTRAAVATVAALCVTAFAATSAASAASWVIPGGYVSATASIQGTLSVQKGTYNPYFNPPVSCPVVAGNAGVQNLLQDGVAQLGGSATGVCANGGNFSIRLWSSTSSAASMTIEGSGSESAPWGSAYAQIPVTVPVVNGSGATKTKLVFNNTLISNTFQGTQQPIRATGNLEISSPSGGTYTLIP